MDFFGRIVYVVGTLSSLYLTVSEIIWHGYITNKKKQNIIMS